MKVSEQTVLAWVESMCGSYGPEEGESYNSPPTCYFLKGVLGGNSRIPYWSKLKNWGNPIHQGLDATGSTFLSFIEGVAATMRAEGVKGIDDDV